MARRPLRRLISSALLGIATTIAIAWSFATGVLDLTVPARFVYRPATESAPALDVTRYDRPGGVFIHARAGSVMAEGLSRPPENVDSLAPPWTRPLLVPWGWNAHPGPKDPGYIHRIVIIRGWPLRALACTLEGVPNPTGYWTFKPVEGFMPWPSWAGFRPLMPGADPPVTFPTRPLWPGFAADSAAFAAVWFIALFAPAVIRRAIRRRRGLCPRCAYDLDGLPSNSPCPECGESEPSRARIPA